MSPPVSGRGQPSTSIGPPRCPHASAGARGHLPTPRGPRSGSAAVAQRRPSLRPQPPTLGSCRCDNEAGSMRPQELLPCPSGGGTCWFPTTKKAAFPSRKGECTRSHCCCTSYFKPSGSSGTTSSSHRCSGLAYLGLAGHVQVQAAPPGEAGGGGEPVSSTNKTSMCD